ncbi:recombination protein RecR [bacterium]|nr:recombination protein RecR [bacterium]NCQ55548.1 recombination protein RecR [Candidatus Parcubacteria bacterium]NCS67559.1 recombination protein RecR [Candidatus Peregrinibacteria bacterium]NCS96276.1 recombination protein RecR [bacterium]
MQNLPQSIQNAIDALSDLPGIGSRSAERLVFNLLRNESGLDQKLALAVGALKENVRECPISFNYCDGEYCPLAISPNRNDRVLCIVETPMDLLAVERTSEYKGRYHVLHGALSPLNKIGPEKLRISQLIKRVNQSNEIEEVILALSGNVEGDATAYYIMDKLAESFKGRVTRLARGIPTGGDLDYLDAGTLSRALMDRREF